MLGGRMRQVNGIYAAQPGDCAGRLILNSVPFHLPEFKPMPLFRQASPVLAS